MRVVDVNLALNLLRVAILQNMNNQFNFYRRGIGEHLLGINLNKDPFNFKLREKDLING
jgi:hypothetical protein